MRDGNYHQTGRTGSSSQSFSLPMRDGNVIPYIIGRESIYSFSLPMRDGNVIEVDPTLCGQTVLAYL